jgi:predicted metal-dependent HD superfamily phosphohydrolase
MNDQIIQKFWRLIEQRHDARAFAVLEAAYSEPDRGYHALSHIAELLHGLDRFAELATRSDLVATAIFWHDAVFRTREVDGRPRDDALNVADSAKLFEKYSAFSPSNEQAVLEMILATRDHLTATASREIYAGFSRDLDLFLDLDLSPLAAPWSHFAANLEKIRFEYAWVPDDVFYRGRLEMLERFRGQALLYRRAETREVWLVAARANLERSAEDMRRRLHCAPSASFG